MTLLIIFVMSQGWEQHYWRYNKGSLRRMYRLVHQHERSLHMSLNRWAYSVRPSKSLQVEANQTALVSILSLNYGSVVQTSVLLG